MSSLSSGAFSEKFNYRPMIDFVGFMNSYNMESQVVAIGTNTENIKSTGTKQCFLNGTYIPALAADAELDISADDEGIAWAISTAYVVNDLRYNTDDNGLVQRYICTVAHTSDADKEPGVGSDWEDYWKKSSSSAVNAKGTVITTAYTQYFLVTAKSDGTLTVWTAGPQVLTSGTPLCKIPNFEPELFCPIGIIKVKNATGSNFTLGTTGLDTAGITDTYYQLIGPVFPHPDNIDNN